MTKRELVKWLEDKREEALANAAEQYRAAVKLHNESLYTKIELEKIAEAVRMHLENAHEEYTRWKEKHKEDVSIPSYYNGVGSQLTSMLNNGIKALMIDRDIDDDTDERKALSKQYDEVKSKINDNYINVIANVQSLKTAKLACEYLESLGFDITKISEKKECTALAVDVDTRYLFVPAKGANNG